MSANIGAVVWGLPRGLPPAAAASSAAAADLWGVVTDDATCYVLSCLRRASTDSTADSTADTAAAASM